MLNGKYIGFIDSDDYVEDCYVEKLLSRAFEKNADMVKCSYMWECFAGNIKSAILYQDLSVTHGLNDKILELDGFIWGSVIKNELFEDFRFPEDFWYEDMITSMIIYRKCKTFEFLDEPLYYYVQHTNNISKKVEKTSEVKCLDQYFLMVELYNLSHEINMMDDEIFYKILLNECGTMLWSRTRGLNKNIRKQVFLCACEFMNQFDIADKVNLNKTEKYFQMAFEKHNEILWNLISQVVRWENR